MYALCITAFIFILGGFSPLTSDSHLEKYLSINNPKVATQMQMGVKQNRMNYFWTMLVGRFPNRCANWQNKASDYIHRWWKNSIQKYSTGRWNKDIRIEQGEPWINDKKYEN